MQAKLPRMLVIGLMSGTSADGVDAVLVEWPDGPTARPFTLLAHYEDAFPGELQTRIHTLAAGDLPGPALLEEQIALDVELGDRFARAALEAAEEAGVSPGAIDAIASHGQTIAHHPERGGTLQIGDPSLIAERTGITTVADFRSRDMALGGEGAPLAPFFHHAVFATPDEGRAALNLGGIANLTWLPQGAGPDDVIAFDVGPANSLVDGVVALASQGAERFDRDGARARRGALDEALLGRLLDDEYLRRAPPKSTGRERYGAELAASLYADAVDSALALDDLVATLTAFTAEGVARACRELLPDSASLGDGFARLLVGGGGASNPAMLDALRRRLPGVSLETFADHGVPIQAAEAMAFSLMGRNALLGIPNHLPRTTGASRAAVLGEIAPAAK